MKTKKIKKNSFGNKVLHNRMAVLLSAGMIFLGTGYLLVQNMIRPADIFVMESRPQVELATSGLKDLEVNTLCGDNLWKKATYTCADGTKLDSAEDPCKSIESWQTYAAKRCEGKFAAVVVPERTATPSGVASESSTITTRPVGDCAKVCTKSIPARCTTTCTMKDGSTTTSTTVEAVKK